MEKSDSLSLTIHGHVRTTEFPEESNVCVKLNTIAQGDWKIISGDAIALSSFSFRGSDRQIFIDLPFECGLRGNCPYMWPRFVLNCFSKDKSGKDCVVGYGVLPIPAEPGNHTCRVHCFLPESSSIVQQMIAKLRGVNAEFVDPLIPATSDGRYACRTSTKGYVDLDLNVSIKYPDTGYMFSHTPVEVKPSIPTTHTVPASIAELANVVSSNKDNEGIFSIQEVDEELHNQ